MSHPGLHHTNYCGNCGHHDRQVALAFRCIQWHNNVDPSLGVTLGICSCVTRTMQISNSTRLVKEVFCMFRHQLCMECDITAVFLSHQGLPLVQGLTILMTLVTNMAFILWCFELSRLVAINVDMICHLASEYHCFLRLAA